MANESEIATLRKELDGKRMSDLTPWQKLLNSILWCMDNSAYGITTQTLQSMLLLALGLRDPGWTDASTPPTTDDLMIVWLKEGWMAMDNYVDGMWQNFGEDAVAKWRPSLEPPEGIPETAPAESERTG